ncbi:CpaF family protein [Polaromonas aquatica]|uniref:CpaF family protein n=1 Tax=Polaromonas aquatica TaxID=332657 RepID=A0ABW1TWV5_9BURK
MHTDTSSAVNPQEAIRLGHTQRVLAQLMDTLAVLRTYFDDVEISEIMINGPDDVFIEKNGKTIRLKVKLAATNIRAAISLIAGLMEKEVGEKNKQRVLSARLPGFRVEAILPPVAVNGPTMCIRRHAARVFSIEEYIASGVISKEYADLLRQAILSKENFLIVGGTGSGKTTMMNTALSMVPQEERLFVIETVHELQIVSPNKVIVECDDEHGMTPRKAVRTAMRYAPKRVIVGELRGPEAYDWMDAANTGHPGSAATIHANSAVRGLGRLENLLLMASMGIPHEALKVAIADSVQWLFFIKRDGPIRKVSEVCRVHDYDRVKGEYILEKF